MILQDVLISTLGSQASLQERRHQQLEGRPSEIIWPKKRTSSGFVKVRIICFCVQVSKRQWTSAVDLVYVERLPSFRRLAGKCATCVSSFFHMPKGIVYA